MGSISYEIRPSKDVTRRIFVEFLRRLAPISDPAQYTYVGFGALEFVDFDLVHRRLGVRRMVSIERDVSSIERYRWNRPFNGIDVLGGRSEDVLADIDFGSALSIVWLDYTSSLTLSVIGDIEHIAASVLPGSIIAVTLNAHPTKPIHARREALEKAIGADNVPVGVTDIQLGDWGLASVQQQVATDSIRSAIRDRPGQFEWRQIFNINYQDNARMQFFGGIVISPGIITAFDSCRFSEIPFYRDVSDAPADVRVPLLTAREKAHINTLLPATVDSVSPEIPGLRNEDIVAYSTIYRWLDSHTG